MIDEATKNEIVAEVSALLDSRMDDLGGELKALLTHTIEEQGSLNVRLLNTDQRLEIVEKAIPSAAAHEREHREILRKAKLYTDAAKHEVMDALEGSHKQLQETIDDVASDVKAMRTNIGKAVMGALSDYVDSIEKSAKKLANAPKVRAQAALLGAFAGSFVVTAGIELYKYFTH